MTAVLEGEYKGKSKAKSKPQPYVHPAHIPPKPRTEAQWKEIHKGLQAAEDAKDGGFSRAVAESEAAVKQENREDRALQKFDDYLYEQRLNREAGFAKGGSVRGAGCAQRGVKKCKIR